MIYCSNCGATLPDNAKFCSGCGTSYNAAEAEQAIPPVAGTSAQTNPNTVLENHSALPLQNVVLPSDGALNAPEMPQEHIGNNPVVAASIPEGFLLDAASGLYYKSEYVQDNNTGLTVNLVTYFDHANAAYSQKTYPVEQQPQQQFQAPQNAAPYNQGYAQPAQVAPQYPQQPAEPKVPSAASQMASEVGVEAKQIFGSFVKDPAQIAADKKLSVPLSVALLVLESASIVFIANRLVLGFMVLVANLVSSDNSYVKSHLLKELKTQKIFEFSNYLVIAIIALVCIGLLVLLAYALPKIIKGAAVKPVDWPDALSITATASIPWTVAYVLAGIILTIASFNIFSVYLAAALVVTAIAAFAMLYDLGLRRHLPSASSRLVGISAGMGISVLVTLFLIIGYIATSVSLS